MCAGLAGEFAAEHGEPAELLPLAGSSGSGRRGARESPCGDTGESPWKGQLQVQNDITGTAVEGCELKFTQD